MEEREEERGRRRVHSCRPFHDKGTYDRSLETRNDKTTVLFSRWGSVSWFVRLSLKQWPEEIRLKVNGLGIERLGRFKLHAFENADSIVREAFPTTRDKYRGFPVNRV